MMNDTASIKKYTFIVLFLFCIIQSCTQPSNPAPRNIILDPTTNAEKNPYSKLDISPMDMCYFPVDYPLQKMDGIDSVPLVARVIYSRPHKKNRVIFGNTTQSLCQYGKEWRLGANEATEIEFYKNVTIGNKNISKGSYILYCIPFPDKWTIVFNSNLHTWGLHIDGTKDIFKIDIPTQVQAPAIEDFTIVFTPAKYGADLLMAWDNVKTTLPISFSK